MGISFESTVLFKITFINLNWKFRGQKLFFIWKIFDLFRNFGCISWADLVTHNCASREKFLHFEIGDFASNWTRAVFEVELWMISVFDIIFAFRINTLLIDLQSMLVSGFRSYEPVEPGYSHNKEHNQADYYYDYNLEMLFIPRVGRGWNNYIQVRFESEEGWNFIDAVGEILGIELVIEALEVKDNLAQILGAKTLYFGIGELDLDRVPGDNYFLASEN